MSGRGGRPTGPWPERSPAPQTRPPAARRPPLGPPPACRIPPGRGTGRRARAARRRAGPASEPPAREDGAPAPRARSDAIARYGPPPTVTRGRLITIEGL